MSIDLQFANHGSIWIMTPHSDAGRGWIAEHIPDDAQRWGIDSVVIEHRYVQDIVEGAVRDGLGVGT